MIYFILDPSVQQVKIGTTKSPETLRRRMKAFACGNAADLQLLHVQNGGRFEESRIHRQYRNLNVPNCARINETSEWFRYEGNLYRYLQIVTENCCPK
jgi:hypothetical protein